MLTIQLPRENLFPIYIVRCDGLASIDKINCEEKKFIHVNIDLIDAYCFERALQ